MALQNKLKAFVRFDGSGRVIPSSLILQKSKPKVGNWKEINATQCCDYVPTTTTTSTTSAPTAFNKQYWLNVSNACNSTIDGVSTFYSSSSTLQAGITVFTNSNLTTPVTQGWVIYTGGMNGDKYLVGANGLLSLYTCPTTTTTTTISVGQESAIGNFNASNACAGTGNALTVYYNNSTPLGVGTALYTDSGLTSPYSPGAFPSGNGTYLRIYFQAQDQVCTMSGNIIQSYTAC